mgnify:FL=1|jgi:hypothetical protein
MYNNWNHHKYLYVKNFIPIEDLNVILKDIEYYFTSNLHKEEKGSVIKSGQQTKPNLHIIGKSKPWKNYYKKLSELASALGKENLRKSWALRIKEQAPGVPHQHKDDSITCVFYVQNPDISLGTHLQENNTDIIIPGHENSLLIFDGTIVHDAIFPTHKLTKPRYSLITDYE